jgi:hypothetical protein
LLILILRGKLIKNSKYNEHFMGSVYNWYFIEDKGHIGFALK